MLLAIGTVALTFISFFFVTVPHSEQYQALSQGDRARRDSNPLHRQRSLPFWKKFGKGAAPREEPSKSISFHMPYHKTKDQLPTSSLAYDEESRPSSGTATPKVQNTASSSESASLLSDESSMPGDIINNKPFSNEQEPHSEEHSHSHRADVTGFALFRHTEFYSLWVMLGILTGIGLMTINNIGNNVQALWYDKPEADDAFVMKRQLMHVSIISIFSFFGRLLSGVGSDYLVKNLGASRFWCLVVSSCIFMLAQVSALRISDPYHLWILSSVSGLGYGALFGVYPALVADTFGVSGLSVNWGFMTLAPVLWGNIFNLAYGGIYDSHSEPTDNGHMVCKLGQECYKGAYVFTFFSSIAGIVCAFWCIWHENYLRKKREREELEHHA